MDLTSIEATSVAVRCGQVAAAELMNLLTHEDEDALAPIEDWFDPAISAGHGLTQAAIHELATKVDRLGAYVCHSADAVSGERLFRWGEFEGIVPRGAQWSDRPFGQRQAFEIFALTTRIVFLTLRGEQQRLEARPEPTQTTLALEDSIFEPVTSLGEQRKESVAAAPLIAAYDKGQEERRQQLIVEIRAKSDATIAGLADKSLDELERMLRQVEAKAPTDPAPPPAPLSAGDTPVRHRGNQGGRGKTKT